MEPSASISVKGLPSTGQTFSDENTLLGNQSLPSSERSLPPLAKAMADYDALGRQRFHVPAHAGHGERVGGSDFLSDPYRYDLTELEGLDVLSDPEGCLAESQEALAQIFKVAHSFMLVNGATVGLLAALLATVQPGDFVLLPRNAHRAVVSGLILTGANPIWFLPNRLADWGLWGGVSLASVQEQLEQNPNIKALVLTSPTYEGLGSDICALSAFCRERNVLLIVDEAHGSLWPLSDRLPTSAIHAGADCVVHSIHKSAGCLTQGALAHLPNGSRISRDSFQQALNIVQTTSPSYLLMASIEACCHFWVSPEGKERLNSWLDHVALLRQNLPSRLKSLQLFEPSIKLASFCDPSKLYWKHPHIQGEEWGPLLEEDLALAYESASPYGVLYQANPALEEADFARFVNTLIDGEALLQKNGLPEETSQSITLTCQEELEKQNPTVLLPEIVLSPREAYFKACELVSPDKATGRIAQEILVRCPPGIPILMPGERISARHLPFFSESNLRVVKEKIL